MIETAVVHVEIDAAAKSEAATVLAAMELSLSDSRLLGSLNADE